MLFNYAKQRLNLFNGNWTMMAISRIKVICGLL